MELVTLSNVLNYGVAIEVIETNPVHHGRPRFRHHSRVAHCRDFAPKSGDELHAIGEELFRSRKSEVLGWMWLFAALTGCRTSELRRLRLDAASEDEPGFVSNNYLFLSRSKGGVNPYALVTLELADLLKCFHYWHQCRYPSSSWYFPGRTGKTTIDPTSLAHALARVCARLEIPKRTAHGARSYFVTLRRSQGVNDFQIATEIGDKDVSLISKTYGDRPPNWSGGKPLSWLPSQGLPCWSRWRDQSQKVVSLR